MLPTYRPAAYPTRLAADRLAPLPHTPRLAARPRLAATPLALTLSGEAGIISP